MDSKLKELLKSVENLLSNAYLTEEGHYEGQEIYLADLESRYNDYIHKDEL